MSSSPTSTSAIAATLRAAGCVFAEDEAELLMSAASDAADLAGMIEQRVIGVPLEYIVGWAEFRGLRMVVEPGVFVPRHRTEFLVDQAAALAFDMVRAVGRLAAGPRLVILDLCCGSGALGASLAAALAVESVPVELYAADVDPAAVRCARRNILPAGGRVFCGDLYEPLPPELAGRVDLLMVNAPYVPSEAIELMPPEARLHEARWSLDGGVDGLDVQRRVLADASRWLAPAGRLLIETSERQAPLTLDIARLRGLSAETVSDDERDASVVIAGLVG